MLHCPTLRHPVTTAYITHPSCMLHDMGPHHPECPERLASIDEHLAAAGLHERLVHHLAPAATRAELVRVHGDDYLDLLDASSPDEGLFFIDPDTALCPQSLDAARHAAGAVVLGVDLVLTGACRTAFCAVRPPGHHAERTRAMGFCVLNSVAVGAAHAMAVYGLSRVAIVDFDVHHGNGTEDIFTGDPRVLMTGTFQYPLYPYSGVDACAPNMQNVPLAPGMGSAAFRAAIEERVLPALDAHRPELLIISAGFDAHHEDPLAGLELADEDFAWVTRQLVDVADRHAQGRIVSALEGGYALAALGRSAVLHVGALLAA